MSQADQIYSNIGSEALAVAFVVKCQKQDLAGNPSSKLIIDFHVCSKQGTPKNRISRNDKMGIFAYDF